MKEFFAAIGLFVLALMVLELFWGGILTVWNMTTERDFPTNIIGNIVIGILWVLSVALAIWGIYRWVF